MPRRCRPLLGTFVEISADDETAISEAFAEIARIHHLMSAHEAGSDVSKINRGAHRDAVLVDPSTMEVLSRSLFWSDASDGAFDIVRAGRAAVSSGFIPRHPAQPLPEALDYKMLLLDHCHVRLNLPGAIDLGGIAKGYAIDRAIEVLRSLGCPRGLVNAGGDLAGFGEHPWPVSIPHSETAAALIDIELSNSALATSARHADAHLPKSWEIYRMASVMAPAAIDADALTKILLSGSQTARACLSLCAAAGLRMCKDGTIENLMPATYRA